MAGRRQTHDAVGTSETRGRETQAAGLPDAAPVPASPAVTAFAPERRGRRRRARRRVRQGADGRLVFLL